MRQRIRSYRDLLTGKFGQVAGILGRRTGLFALPLTPAEFAPAADQPPPGDASRAASLTSFLTVLAQAVVGLPYTRLLEGERQRLGGFLFSCAPVFVQQLCHEILDQPHLYTDLLERVRALLGRQAEATAWQVVRDTLGTLHARAGDSYLAAQADATQGAVAIYERLRDDFVHGGQTEGPAWERFAGITPAAVLLEEHRAELQQKKEQRHKAKAAPRPEAPPQTPRQQKAREQALLARRKDMYAGLYGFLQRWHRRAPDASPSPSTPPASPASLSLPERGHACPAPPPATTSPTETP